MKTAVYAGSFDPITHGHLDIVRRALKIFDNLVVVVAVNSSKKALFPVDVRERLVKAALLDDEIVRAETARVLVRTLADKRLLVDFAKEIGACAMVRGLRPVQDFPVEFSLASVNRRIAPEIETVMLVTDPSVAEVSSSMVKELVALGGPFEQFVPAVVAERLKNVPVA